MCFLCSHLHFQKSIFNTIADWLTQYSHRNIAHYGHDEEDTANNVCASSVEQREPVCCNML